MGKKKEGRSGEPARRAHADTDDNESLTRKERAERAMREWPPSAKDFRAWMDVRGLSSKDVAKALKLSDGRVVRFWTSKKKPRLVPYPSWYTLKHKFEK